MKIRYKFVLPPEEFCSIAVPIKGEPNGLNLQMTAANAEDLFWKVALNSGTPQQLE